MATMHYPHDPDCAEQSCGVEKEFSFTYKGREVIAIAYGKQDVCRSRIDIAGYVVKRGERTTELERIATPQERKGITQRLRARGIDEEIDFW